MPRTVESERSTSRAGGVARLVIAVAALAATCQTAAGGTVVSAYAFTDAGETGCNTFGPTSEMRAAITGGYGGVSTPGAGCGTVFSKDFISASGGPLTANSSGSASMSTEWGAGSTIGDSSSNANFDRLGVFSEISYTGASDSHSVAGSESFGMYTDGWVASDPTAATMQVTYHLSGSQTVSNRGDANLYVLYQKNGGPQLGSFIARDDPAFGGVSVYVGGVGYVSSGNGIVIGANSISVNTDLSFSIPVSYNEKFDLTILMYGSSLPLACWGCTSTAVDSFSSTLVVTGYNLYDNQGHLIQNPVITRDSAATPEPASFSLLVLALIAFAARSLRGVAGGKI